MSTSAAARERVNYNAWPDESGHFGPYGGKFVPETLMPALDELEEAYLQARNDKDFMAELAYLQRTFIGRPTPITFARRLTEHFGGAKIFLKREDLAHTGAHKINNALGQALLMKRKMGKTRIVAETGAGQHGVATATAAALLGIECVVYMGTVDMARQEPNVFRMRLLGTEVRGVESGSKTLKDAINEAIRDWVTNVQTTHYLLGSALGPHPYPAMVRDSYNGYSLMVSLGNWKDNSYTTLEIPCTQPDGGCLNNFGAQIKYSDSQYNQAGGASFLKDNSPAGNRIFFHARPPGSLWAVTYSQALTHLKSG